MPHIRLGNLLIFAPNIGVLVEKEALASSPDSLYEAVRTAYSHMEDEPLVQACCGATGPLSGYGEISYDEYVRLLEKISVVEAGAAVKKEHTKRRRLEFNSKRSALVLAMIDAGAPYVCDEEGCGVHEYLTVDHIVALSRGGTDDLSNLRFLCISHNSEKGDKNLCSRPSAGPT